LVQAVYGPFCIDVLSKIGVHTGQRVADIGCGTGTMTAWLADQVGPDGKVVAVDTSSEQLAIARQQTSPRENISFIQASAYDTGLPRAYFDIAHCRLMLLHIVDPLSALLEMAALLRPGGTVICFDIDLRTVQSLPPTEAYERYLAVALRTAAARGVDFTIGSRLHTLFDAAGLPNPEIRFHHPVYLHGEEKRLFEYTFSEAAPKRIELGVSTAEEGAEIQALLAAVAADRSIAIAQARMTACWATKRDAT
jgi:SAM-dependent methyltransferase